MHKRPTPQTEQGLAAVACHSRLDMAHAILSPFSLSGLAVQAADSGWSPPPGTKTSGYTSAFRPCVYSTIGCSTVNPCRLLLAVQRGLLEAGLGRFGFSVAVTEATILQAWYSPHTPRLRVNVYKYGMVPKHQRSKL